MASQPPRERSTDPAVEALWRETLLHGHPGRWSFLPSDPRCMICHQPFSGLGGRMLRAFTGYQPSRLTPTMCNYCDDILPPGGAEIDVAVLFADLRGSTTLGERMGSGDYAALVDRFYHAASDVLIREQSWIDNLVGDEVMALYFPGMGPDYRARAVHAGVRLLEAVGYGPGGEPWVAVGVGVHAGQAFVGKVGVSGVNKVTALGDTINTGARIQASAGAGELLMSEELYASVRKEYPDLEQRRLEVRGRESNVDVRVIRPQER